MINDNIARVKRSQHKQQAVIETLWIVHDVPKQQTLDGFISSTCTRAHVHNAHAGTGKKQIFTQAAAWNIDIGDGQAAMFDVIHNIKMR